MEDLLKIFKALSNKNRLEIFNLIREKAYRCRIDDKCKVNSASCVTEIAEKIKLAQSTVSHHLKELYNAGLIRMEKQGLWVYCSINEKALKSIEEFIKTSRR
jgi:ArsR family transcriptional regulator